MGHEHGHEHAPGVPEHEHGEEIMEIFPGEAIKVRFVREDGSYVTVHWRGDELRACGSEPVTGVSVKADVVALVANRDLRECFRCACDTLVHRSGVCEMCRRLASAEAAQKSHKEE